MGPQTDHVWEGVEKEKAAPDTWVPIRIVNAGSTRGDTGRHAETMRVNPHVPVNAGTAGGRQSQQRKRAISHKKTQARTWTRLDHVGSVLNKHYDIGRHGK